MSYEAVGAVTEVNAGNITLTKPSGTNDASKLLVAVVMTNRFDPGEAGFTAPSGWTALHELQQVDAGALCMYRAAGDVADLNFVQTGGAGNNDLMGVILRFGGRNMSTPETDSDGATTNSATATCPAQTAVLGDDGIWAWLALATGTWGSLTGSLTARVTNAGTPMILTVATEDNLAAGSTGTRAATHTNGTISKGTIGALLAQGGGSVIVPMGKRIFVNG